MRHPHDRFDALAGAVMLDEASDAERAEFARHARSCARCADDLAALVAPPAATARIVAEREAETWRPDVTGAVLTRVRARREGRTKFVFGALGGALALSLVVDLAMFSGLGARALALVRPQPVLGIVPSGRVAAPLPAVPAFAAVAASRTRSVAQHRPAKGRAEHVALQRSASAPSALAPRLDDAIESRAGARDLIPTQGVVVADPLAGTPLEPTVAAGASASARHVAIDPRAIPKTLRR